METKSENREIVRSKRKEGQKAFLFLGGTVLATHVIKTAKRMGYYTLCTDYIKGAPAKAYADESFDISATDVDAVVELCREKKVDGVFTGYADVVLEPCARICERLNLPFYATPYQLEQTMNKINFKNLCRRHQIRVAEDIDPELIAHHPEKIDYPVIVKPADSYSSRGISVVYKPEELAPAIEFALEASPCGQYLVEEYIVGEDIYMYFMIQDGKVSLSAMADRLLNDSQKGKAPQPVGYFLPSRYVEKCREELVPKIQNLCDEIGLKNGSFFEQGFVVDGEIILFEMGLRLSGGCGYLSVRHMNEIDPLVMHVNYAMTGAFAGWDLIGKDEANFPWPHCVLVILLRNGVITKIEGLEEVLACPGVFDIAQFRNLGDVMDAAGTLNQVFARIFMYGETKEELKKTVSYVADTLKISDEHGENMILDLFDPDVIIK